jgi:hypothetical protein
VNQNGVRHMSARYMLDCVDKDGEPLPRFVENKAGLKPKAALQNHTDLYDGQQKARHYLHCNNFQGRGAF